MTVSDGTAGELRIPGYATRSVASPLPPMARPRYPGEFLSLLARDHLRLFRRLAESGDVVQVRMGRERLVLISHPDDIEHMLVTEQRFFVKGRALDRVKTLLGEGLLTSEDPTHRRHRRLLQPAFHRERIAGHAAIMSGAAERAAMERFTDGGVVDLHREMMRLTRDIAGRALFSLEVGEDPGGVEEAIGRSLETYRLAVLPMGALLLRLSLRSVRRAQAAQARMNAWLLETIRARRAEGHDRGDLLSMLLAAHDPEGAGQSGGVAIATGLSDQEVRDEMVTLLLAGHETTAVALSWTWFLLSQHPDVEARLLAELDAVLGTGGRVPAAEDIPRLVYTRMVFSEAMRLFPPAWALERRALRDVELGGHRVPAGSLVFTSQFLVHRDPRWWPEPERFDPERWRPGREAERPKFAYFPFGGGSRVCIGEPFAWMEGVLLLATISRRWRFAHERDHPVTMDPLVTLRPRYGMRMRAVRR